MKALNELKPKQRGIIHSIQPGLMSEKLMEMGFLPGEEIVVEQLAPFGDPMMVSIVGYKLSIRKADAAQILVDETAP